jgi:CRP-like cAMP-binding protein
MLQEYARLKTGLEFRQRLHEVRGDLSPAVPAARDGEDDPQFAMRRILALQRGPVQYPRNKMIFIEGDPAEYIFLLIDGVVRSCRSFSDGNRSIVCFHISGELFGFNGEQTHSLSAEAATNTTMLVLKRSAVLAMVARDGRIANLLLANTTKELRFFGSDYEESILSFFRKKYRDKAIDVVVVVGSSALDFVSRRRGELWPNVPVVFAAIDEATIAKVTLPPNVTGVTMQLTLQDMVRTADVASGVFYLADAVP